MTVVSPVSPLAHGDAVFTLKPVPTARAAVTRVLVILAYWGAHDSVTQHSAKSLVITQGNRWYRAASYGRQGLTGTATAWLKIGPQSCGDFGTFGPAEAAARRAHYNTAAYDRVIIYEPCSLGYEIGLGQEPGNKVMLFSGGMNLPTAVHEQGHNYGSDHANFLECTRRGKRVTYTAGGTCTTEVYDDIDSAMGLEWNPKVAGDFSAPEKAVLGWLNGKAVAINGSGSATLSPYETSAGIKAIKVPGSAGRTYWLEYRTARGNDAHLPKGDLGVLVHMSVAEAAGTFPKLSQSLLLDMVPHGAQANLDESPLVHVALPPGSSWTSPEGIRITVSAQRSAAATISVSRHHTARKPTQVTGVRVAGGDSVATISFHRAMDNGKVIQSYLVTAHPSGRAESFSDFTSATTLSAHFTGLTNGRTYTFTVQARNELGVGPAVQSPRVRPLAALPSVVITAPIANASVAGLVTISARATANRTTGKPIQQLEFFVDGQSLGSSSTASSHVSWDTALIGSGATGPHTITVKATDSNGRVGVQTISVTVTATSAPSVTMTTPTGNATVHGQFTIAGTLVTTTSDAVAEVDLTLDGNFVASVPILASAPATSTWTVTWDGSSYAGAHQLQAIVSDNGGRTGRSAVVAITIVNPPPTLSFVSRSNDPALPGYVIVNATVTNNSDTDGYMDVQLLDAQGGVLQDKGVDAPPGSMQPVSFEFDASSYEGTRSFSLYAVDPIGVAGSATFSMTN
jgi:hypothetical protein